MKKDFNEIFIETIVRKVKEQDPNYNITDKQQQFIKDY